MLVNGCEQHRIENQADEPSEKSPDHPIKKKAKDKFFRDRGDHHRQKDNNDAFLHRSRAAEQFDDILLGAFPGKILGDDIPHVEQWIGK